MLIVYSMTLTTSSRGIRLFTLQGCLIASSQIRFIFANLLTARYPPLAVRSTPLLALLVKRGPVNRVIVHKVDVTAVGLVKLRWRDVLSQVLIEDHLLLCDGIDERTDELEKGGDVPRN